MGNLYTQEQIDGMSRFDVNKAAAEKWFTTISWSGENSKGDLWLKGASREGCSREIITGSFSPSSRPEDYMPIAIKHGIGIMFSEVNDTVFCDHPTPNDDARNFGVTREYPRTDTGLAVCAAFLMMEVE